ncbi:hypothetical protein PINS_up004562 [Pythium insidiosum]|nr:hypothetical protein PINS_up004562 [Pythium insidiosum]
MTMRTHSLGISDVLDIQPYNQARKRIDNDRIDELFAYLRVASKVCHTSTVKKKLRAERLVFPFIACVLSLLGDGAKLGTDVKVSGDLVHCNVKFEFLLKRGDRRLCISVAKKGCIRDCTLSRAIAGAEALADLEERVTEEVFCVVTDFIDWYFTCLSLDSVVREHYSLTFEDGSPTRATVAAVTEKLYCILAGGT